MKAYKIDIENYAIEKARLTETGMTEKYGDFYETAELIANIMLHPTQKHKGYRFHTVSKVADKITDCKKSHVVLDAKDYEIVKECFDNFEGYGKHDKLCVRRIYDAEEVEAEEKKKK